MRNGRLIVQILSTVAIVALSVLLAGCRQAGSGGEAGGLRGTITVSGAWALYPMMVRWGEEFKALHPGVEFDISAGGAGKGMADALAGAVDIGMVSRDVHEDEIKQGAFWVTVVSDAVVPTINAHNPHLALIQRRGLDRAAFEAIWTGKARTWGEVLGDESIKDEIHAFTRSDACGAAETWAAYLGGYRQEDLQGIAVYGDPGVAEAVSKDPLGIGFNNLNFAYDANTRQPVAGLAIAPIDVNGNGSLEAEENFYANKGTLMAAIADGRYPSPPARGLHLVTKGKPTGLTLTFIRWVLTDGQAFAEETGYVPLTQAQAQAELQKLE
ncbi:MAG: PstS family phosphate ABC transporter substrate-binding protein [Anaerolineae bacterium]|nr:PstS family phosphate ABC transporter substrate-binding protein [Anaerolineae bacterium]